MSCAGIFVTEDTFSELEVLLDIIKHFLNRHSNLSDIAIATLTDNTLGVLSAELHGKVRRLLIGQAVDVCRQYVNFVFSE